MIRLLFIALALFVSIWVGLQLSLDPGHVLISLNQWTVEMSFWVGLALMVLLFFLFHSSLLFLHWICAFPARWKHWVLARRVKKAQEKTRQGLIEFSEGYWWQAKKHLLQALPNTDTPLLNYLTAARAAQETGETELRDDYLREAQQSMPEARIAVELTQAQLQLSNHQWEQALATLKHLQTLAPNHPYVLKLLARLYEDIGDWVQLLALLPELKRNRVITEKECSALEQLAHLNLIKQLIQQNNLTAVTRYFNQLPRRLKSDTRLLAEYCRYLITQSEDKLAESLLKRALKKSVPAPLIELYGQLDKEAAHLTFVESFLTSYPYRADVYLALGRLSQAQQLWGKAKTYFEQSIQLKATPVAYAELGQLLEQLNELDAAREAYRQGICLCTSEASLPVSERE